MAGSYESSSPGGEVLRYLRAVRRRAELVLLPVVIVPCAALVGLSVVPSTYEATSIVLYEQKMPFAGDMEKMLVQKPEYRTRDSERLGQIEARLKGRVFLQEVARKLGLDLNEKDSRKLRAGEAGGVSVEELKARVIAERLKKNIKVEETDPDLFKITFTHPDKDMVYFLADGITKSFVQFVTKGQLADIRAAGSFSQDQLPAYEKKLRDSEAELKRVKARMAAGSGGGYDRDLERARSLIREAGIESRDLEARASGARDNIRRDYPNEIDPTTLVRSGSIRSAYAELVREEESAVRALVEAGSGTAARDRIGQAREALLARIEEVAATALSGSPAALRSLVTEVVYDEHVANSLEARKSGLSGLITSYGRSVVARPYDEVEVARLEQEVENNRNVLQSLKTQLTSAQISEAAQSTNLGIRIEIIEPPARPFGPAGPRRERVLVLALILGPFLGLSFAVFAEYMDNTVRSVDHLSKGLGLPVLGTIPRMPGSEFWHPVKRRKWPYLSVLAAIVVALIAQLAHGPIMNATGKNDLGIQAPGFSGRDDGAKTSDE
ncbi:MAG: hypothetical protein JW952_01600 [Candidatus Eisenbacteria bacterium]|nr:hypothetical protein [Candidatus Eisenbacteria bacterium]